MPGGDSIQGRISAMRSTFVRSLIPAVQPTEEELEIAFDLLELDPDDLECVYCGDYATEWDHFRPVMEKGRPTGYLTVIENLVPACSKCNQSKGNSYWETWMTGPARWSPRSIGVVDIRRRIKRLRNFERWGEDSRIDVEDLLSRKDLAKHWEAMEEIALLMEDADVHAQYLQEQIAAELPEMTYWEPWWRKLIRWITGF